MRFLPLLCLAGATAFAAPASDRLNVLFISIDDLRTELGAYGAKRALTPHLDRLAAQGVRFDRAYCQYPLCNPSRTSLLTGRYPVTSELYGNRDNFTVWYSDWVSLPKFFLQQGYVTARFGKIFHGDTIDDAAAWTIGGVRSEFNAPKPARSVAAEPITDEQEQARIARMLSADLARRGTSDFWKAVSDPAELAQLGDTVNADRAIAFLQARRPGDAPFFLGFGANKPHSPLVAPKKFFDLYDAEKIELPPDFAPRPTVPPGFPAGSIRMINADLFIKRDASPPEAREMIRAYLACTSYADDNVGRVLAALDAAGLRESTLIVVWSDHGYQLGEKGKWSKAGSLWEQGTRVPLLILDPRAKGNGTASPRVVELLDLYATIVARCGFARPAGIEGRDLSPLLDSPAATWDHPAFTVWNERSRGVSGVAVRTERWRYAEFFGPGAGAFLTDSQNDPHELTNLVADPRYADVVAKLSALARAHVAGKAEPTAPKR